MHSVVYRSSTSAKTLGRLALLGLAILAVASCQTEPEKPQGRQTYTADLPAIPDTLMPQRGVIKAQSDTATAIFTVLPASIKIDLDAPPAETVKVDLWRAGVKMYELDYVHDNSQRLVYTRSKREYALAVKLIRRIYPASDSLTFATEFARLLVDNDPLVLSLGFPAKSIEGVDTALVMRKAMEIVVVRQRPVSSVIPKDGPWALGLDSAALHARIQELVREGKIEADTAKLFPPYPVRTKNGIALDAQLVAGGPAVGVTGAFEATYKIVNLSSRVLRDGQESGDFEIPTLAFSEYPKLLELSGKLNIRAKESAAAGLYILEITAQDDSLRKAVSTVEFHVVPAADKQGPKIEITSPVANTVLENSVDRIDVKAVVSDPSGVDSVWIDNRAASLIDGKWTVEGVSIPVTNLGYKVVVRARDSKGNESKADIIVGRMAPLDPGAPVTSVVQPKETEFPFDSASVLVRWKIEDPRAEVTKVWIGGEEAVKEEGFVWSRRVNLPPTGTPTTITFLGINEKNDSTQKFVQLTRKIDTRKDTSKPTIVREAGTETKNVGFDVGEISVGWKVIDNAAVTVKIDGSRVEPNASGVYGATIVLVKASTGVKIEATDAAGNSRVDSITITKASDVTDPVVVRQTGTKDTTVLYAIVAYSVAWKVTDNGGVKTVEIGGKTPSKNGDIYSYQVALTKPGKFVVKIVALDEAGNDFVDSVTIARAYHDSIAPVVTPADTATRTKTVPYATAKATLSWKVTDNDALYSVTIGGSVVPGNAGTYSSTVVLPLGASVWRIVATDTAGNIKADSVSIFRETKDTIPPVIKLAAGVNLDLPFDSSAAKISWTVSDNQKLATVQINGVVVNVMNGKYEISLKVAVGSVTVRIVAMDSAGNASRDSVVVIRNPDKTPPIIAPIGDYSGVYSYRNLPEWISVGVIDNDSVAKVLIQGVEAQYLNGVYSFKAATVPGVNRIPVEAVDRAGNREYDTIRLTTRLFDRAGNSYSVAKMPDGRYWTTQNIYAVPAFSVDTAYGVRLGLCALDSCEKYGRYYSWAMALNLRPECDTMLCEIDTTVATQGLCPNGSHVPKGSEWKKLVNAADPTSDSLGAIKLKSKAENGLWGTFEYDNNGGLLPVNNESGTDEYGFNLLPSFLVGTGGYGAPSRLLRLARMIVNNEFDATSSGEVRLWNGIYFWSNGKDLAGGTLRCVMD